MNTPNKQAKIKWYERSDYQGMIIFALMFIFKIVFVLKDFDINKYIPWDFIMGLFLELAILGGKK